MMSSSECCQHNLEYYPGNALVDKLIAHAAAHLLVTPSLSSSSSLPIGVVGSVHVP